MPVRCTTLAVLSLIGMPVDAQVMGGEAPCSCWIPPDSTYVTIDNDSLWDADGFNDADDGAFGPIDLPFDFNLYGTLRSEVYINVNGDLSFTTLPSNSFSAIGFPNSIYAMVAPFWADADLRGTGTGINIVQFKSTPTALYVNWTNVGYYSMQTDKLNSFQVIISDGTDPAIPGGNNVSFCYGSMQWTAGWASGGINGFGGTPAVAGANAGDGTDYLRLGRFDHAGEDWDGATNSTDGIDWLTDRHFSFSTASDSIAPIFMGIDCDTLDIQVGSSFIYPGWSTAGFPSIGPSRSIALQPNPADDQVTVSWPAELRPALVQVIAMDGSLVMARAPEPGATRMQLDVGNLAHGVYIVRVSSSSGVSTARLVRVAQE